MVSNSSLVTFALMLSSPLHYTTSTADWVREFTQNKNRSNHDRLMSKVTPTSCSSGRNYRANLNKIKELVNIRTLKMC